MRSPSPRIFPFDHAKCLEYTFDVYSPLLVRWNPYSIPKKYVNGCWLLTFEYARCERFEYANY